jgi:hypothetical protein
MQFLRIRAAALFFMLRRLILILAACFALWLRHWLSFSPAKEPRYRAIKELPVFTTPSSYIPPGTVFPRLNRSFTNFKFGVSGILFKCQIPTKGREEHAYYVSPIHCAACT